MMGFEKHKQEERALIAAQVEAYLAKGGTIKEYPITAKRGDMTLTGSPKARKERLEDN